MKKIILSLILIFGIFSQNSQIFAQQTVSPESFSQFLQNIGESKGNLNSYVERKDIWKISLKMAGFQAKSQDSVYYIREAFKILDKSEKNNPNLFAKKYETLKFLFKLFGVNTPYFNDQIMDFADIQNDDPIVSKCLELGICKGQNNKIFGKNSPITRGQFYQYLIKIYSFTHGNQNKDNLSKDKKFLILENIFNTIENEYYKRDGLDESQLIYGAAEGMAKAVGDKYTKFFKPVKSKDFKEVLTGSFDGIGAYIEGDKEGIKIITPMNGSPAKEYGLKAGDVILEADGNILKNYPLEKGVNFIKGKSGTFVKLKIKRGTSVLNIYVKRGKVNVPSVESKNLDNGILYIKINQFGANTDKELFEVLFENKKSEKIIFDLRNNPGGYLEVAKNILSMFVKSGEPIVKVKYPNFETTSYSSEKIDKFKDKKIAILINGGSASASEIFSGTMQDYGLAKLFGEKSYGKGTVQNLVDFYDGSQFKLTIANWKTGKGRMIDGKGIMPDEKIFQDDEKFGDEVVKRVENYLR